MEINIHRNRITIIPDDDDARDEAFIEEVLGLKKDGDWVKCKRVNAMELDCIAYLEIEKEGE